MIKLIVVTILLIISNCDFSSSSSDLCKLTGDQGKSSPDILSLVKGQKGYSGIIEIIESSQQTSQQFTNQLKDVYDSSGKFGSIEWLNSGERSTSTAIKSVAYYFSSNESFTIDDGPTPCKTNGLTLKDKRSIIFEWISPEMRNFYNTNRGHLKYLLGIENDSIEYLGPTVLMIMASSLSSSSGYYMGQKTLDGFTVDQWSLCLSPDETDLVVDTYFLTKTNLPYRLVISGQSSSSSKTLVNFLTYDPITPKTDHPLTFPIGYGCQRTYKYDNPTWAMTSSYLIDMKASISFSSPERLQLSTIKLIKCENFYSFLISQGDSNTTRIIKTPSLLQYFQVDPRTGFCSIEHEKSFYTLLSKDITTQWPLLTDNGIKYNLLSPSLFTLDGTNFLGTIKTDFGMLNVFEKIIDSFYTNSNNERVNCLVQFYFPATGGTTNGHQPPHHVIIRPFSSSVDDEVLMATIPSRIEITYVDYKTNDNVNYDVISPIDYADAFDVSGCYDQPGQYTWFQLVFPDTTLDITQYQGKESIIYHDFLTLIEPLIPLLRLSQVRVTIFGPNIYITCKLLQAETFSFVSLQSNVLANPTRLVVREYMEDCSELCLDSEYCSAFSHCGNMECYLFINSPSDGKTYQLEHRENCTVYLSMSNTDLSSKSQAEINLLKSSRNILYQLQRKLEHGQLILPHVKLSAGDLFIVNGPDEIGGVDEELTLVGQSMVDGSTLGDDYKILIPSQRFTIGSRVVGLNYKSCLSLCGNDDDCLTLSYCPAPTSECVILNKTIDQIQTEYKQISSYVDGCNILSKSFLSFYRKLPGRSLVLDAMVTIPNVQPDECSRQCSLSVGFDCQSFDFCPKIENNGNKRTESACFLHNFHVATDRAHQLDSNIWDFANAECDHYSRKFSKDYQHFIGRKLRASARILETKEDISLENCAFQCNNLPGQCVTFEYCESGDSSFSSTCRLTSYLPYGYNDNLLESTSLFSPSSSSSSSSLCSVYVNKNSRARFGYGHLNEVEGGLGMAIALGAFFFISAFAIGTIASHLYIKRYNF